jgi:hypothetical protein
VEGVSGLVSLEGYAVTLTRFDGKTYEIKGALPAAHRLWARGVAVVVRLIRDNQRRRRLTGKPRSCRVRGWKRASDRVSLFAGERNLCQGDGIRGITADLD